MNFVLIHHRKWGSDEIEGLGYSALQSSEHFTFFTSLETRRLLSCIWQTLELILRLWKLPPSIVVASLRLNKNTVLFFMLCFTRSLIVFQAFLGPGGIGAI